VLNEKYKAMAVNILHLLQLLPPPASSEAYLPYRHSKLFIESMYKQLPQDRKGIPQSLPEIMETLGYKDKPKLLRRISQWLNLEGKIPLKFLSAIGITKDDLLWFLEFDKTDFYEALKNANRPKDFRYKIMPCVYAKEDFPIGTPEEAAIEYVRAFMKNQPEYIQKHGASIIYPDLKSIYIEHDGSVRVTYYVPEVVFKQGYVIFKTQIMQGTVNLR
jgi:hypothetical protein